MSEDRATEILKNAILLEKRGQAFYTKVAQQAGGEAVRQFFLLMAEEEVNHVRILSEQFKAYRSSRKFAVRNYGEQGEFNTLTAILTKARSPPPTSRPRPWPPPCRWRKTPFRSMRAGPPRARTRTKKRSTSGWRNGKAGI